GLDRDALDLEALADPDRVVASPRSMHLAVRQMLGTAIGLEPIDYRFYLLHPVLARDKRGVGRVDDDQVVHPYRRHQPVFGGPDKAAPGVDCDHVALGAVV